MKFRTDCLIFTNHKTHTEDAFTLLFFNKKGILSVPVLKFDYIFLRHKALLSKIELIKMETDQ